MGESVNREIDRAARPPRHQNIRGGRENRSATQSKTKYVYFFGNGKAEGQGTWKDLLGGKGAGLAEMTNAGVPVPPGFTITTEVCNKFYENGKKVPEGLDAEMRENLAGSRQPSGSSSAIRRSPCSFRSVRGEVLDAGDDGHGSEPGFERPERRRAGPYDGERAVRVGRLPPVHPDVRERRPGDREERVRGELSRAQGQAGREAGHGPLGDDLKELVKTYKSLVREDGPEFPAEPAVQLECRRDAVFNSWNNPRAVTYRKLNDIPATSARP